MDRIELTRDGASNRFSVALTRGGDTLRCMVTVADASETAGLDDAEMRRRALAAARTLAKAFDAALAGDPSRAGETGGEAFIRPPD